MCLADPIVSLGVQFVGQLDEKSKTDAQQQTQQRSTGEPEPPLPGENHFERRRRLPDGLNLRRLRIVEKGFMFFDLLFDRIEHRKPFISDFEAFIKLYACQIELFFLCLRFLPEVLKLLEPLLQDNQAVPCIFKVRLSRLIRDLILSFGSFLFSEFYLQSLLG